MTQPLINVFILFLTFRKISSTCPVESEHVGNLSHTPTKGLERQEGHHPQPHDGGVHRSRQDPQLEDRGAAAHRPAQPGAEVPVSG
jgi:hypothetical protein